MRLLDIDVQILKQVLIDLLSSDRQENLDGLDALDTATGLPIKEIALAWEDAIDVTLDTVKVLHGIHTRDCHDLATRAAAHYKGLCEQ